MKENNSRREREQVLTGGTPSERSLFHQSDGKSHLWHFEPRKKWEHDHFLITLEEVFLLYSINNSDKNFPVLASSVSIHDVNDISSGRVSNTTEKLHL